MKVQSFEVSEAAEFGDLKSADRKNNEQKLKVGVIAGGWFEWWQMFPKTELEKTIKQDAELMLHEMKRHFSDICTIIFPGMIDTINSAYDAGLYFKENQVDLIIIAENTYLTDFIPLETLEQVYSVPVIVFSTQATKSLDSVKTNIDVIRYEGLVSIAQLIGAFKKINFPYQIVVGALDDDDSYKKIYMHLKAYSVIKKLKNTDIGLLGHTFRGMYDIEVDKTKIKGAIGPNVLYIDVQHLLDIWRKIETDEVDKYIDYLAEKIPVSSRIVTMEDKKKSISLGIAAQKLVKKFSLDGLSLLGQHHVEVATRASADFSFYAIEETGCMTTHEGDLGNLVMKKILFELSRDIPVFLEWTAFDEPTNTLLLTHHGVVTPKHAKSLDTCSWTPSPEKWDFTGNGLSLEFTAKSGGATLASLIDDSDGWKLLYSYGYCEDLPVVESRKKKT